MLNSNTRKLHIMFWGTYDLGKPRARLLLAGAEASGFAVMECHKDIWNGLEDKSRLLRPRDLLRQLLKALSAYPRLVYRYLKAPSHDAVIVSYLGHLDVLVLWPFVRYRKVPLIWDAFISLYDTIVFDRRLLRPNSIFARLLFWLEWIICRAADQIFLDTAAHARYFEDLYKLPRGHVGRVLLGAEHVFFSVPAATSRSTGCSVLFYGQFTPLHGTETIIRAAKLLEEAGRPVRWIIIGQGQEGPRVDELIRRYRLSSIQRVAWVPYQDLPRWIAQADICLGIFGTSPKANHVIPNKLYQYMAAGRPFITADTPAVREVIEPNRQTVLIPPADPKALADAVINLQGIKETSPVPPCGIDQCAVGGQLRETIERCLEQRRSS